MNNRDEHYKISHVTIEEAARSIEEYLSTTNGKRFLRSIELAQEFSRKHDHSGLDLMQLHYLTWISITVGILDAIMTAYQVGFRKGYQAAKRQQKK